MRINPFCKTNNIAEDKNPKNKAINATTYQELASSDFKATSDAITAIGKASISFKAKKINEEIEKSIIEKHNKGLSIEEIKSELNENISLERISIIIKKQEQIDKIIELYCQGKTKKEISKILETNEQTVINKLRKLENIEEIETEHIKNSNRTIVNDKIIETMIQLYRRGDTAAEIGKVLGCSELTVSRRLKKLENWEEIREEHTKNYNKTNQTTGKRTIVTPEATDKIVELYRQGLSAKKIAEITNYGETTIGRCISKQPNKSELEIEHKSNLKIKSITPKIENEIVELYKQGKSTQEISKIIDISPDRILKKLRDNEAWDEIEKEHTQNQKIITITPEITNTMIELYKQGISANEIAEKLNCSVSTVSRQIGKQENKDELIKIHKMNSKNKEIKEATIITNELLKEIIDLYKQGKSYTDIGKLIGCNPTTVKRNLQKLENWQELEAENKRNTTKKIITTEDIVQMIQMYKQGKGTKEIGEILNCDKSTVSDYIEKQPDKEKIKEEHNKNITKTIITDRHVQQMIKLYKQGKSSKEISNMLGCSKSTVKVYLKKFKDQNELKNEHIKNYNSRSNGRILVTADLIEKMAKLRKEGKSTRRIATILGCSKSAVIDNLAKREDILEIENTHKKNQKNEKNSTINSIIKEHESGLSIKDLSKKYDYTESTIKCIIAIKEKKLDYTETKEHQYDAYSLDELQGRIVEFYIENTIENSTLENIIDFIDSQEDYLIEKNKSILIGLCRDLDKIEQKPENTNEILEASNSIPTIENWIIKEKEEEKAFELLHEQIGEMHIKLQTNELFNAVELLESVIPTNKKEKEKIETIKKLIKIVDKRLNNQNVQNNDRNYVNNLITYYSYNKDSKSDLLILQKAIKIYNINGKNNLSIENLKNKDEATKEKLGQIINISKILENNQFNERLANEYKYFIDIYRNKEEIKEKAIVSLVKLDNYFKQNNNEKYLYKNFEPLSKECLFEQDLVKIFLDKIYKYSYKNIGNDKIDLELTNSVLEDNIWKKTLNAKEKSDFIKTLENGILDLNPRSRGRINVIKGEGKIESGGKKYQLVELKIDSQWRIFGYQDPNNGKRFIFDKIGRDDNGINTYKANFSKTHPF